MENYSNPLRRQLEWWEIQKLQAQECTCDDWQRVRISDRTDLSRIRNVEFKGDIEIGKMLSCNSEIRNAMIDNCRIGDNVRIVNVGVAIRNYEIDNDAEIRNVGLMEYEDEARCGLGVQVNVARRDGFLSRNNIPRAFRPVGRAYGAVAEVGRKHSQANP